VQAGVGEAEGNGGHQAGFGGWAVPGISPTEREWELMPRDPAAGHGAHLLQVLGCLRFGPSPGSISSPWCLGHFSRARTSSPSDNPFSPQSPSAQGRSHHQIFLPASKFHLSLGAVVPPSRKSFIPAQITEVSLSSSLLFPGAGSEQRQFFLQRLLPTV